MRRTALPIALLLTLAVIATACGGDDAAGPTTSSSSTSTSSTTTTVDDTPPVESTTTSSTTTTTSTTTVPSATPIQPLAPDEIHDLVVEWAEGTGDPLDLAERITGFPVAVPVPAGAAPHRIDVRLRSFESDGVPVDSWDWSYETLAPGPVADVDISLDDNGPGAVELRETYDPLLADLGWAYSNSTGSDPGDKGGPNSINHVYVTDTEIDVGDVEASPRPLFVWLREDVIFGDEENPGHQIDVTLHFRDEIVPVPMLATLADAVPELPGARLVSAQLRSLDRPADSFSADEGLRYLDAELVWSTGAASDPGPIEILSSGLDGVTLQPGEESFFDEGTIELVEPTVLPDEWTLPVIVVGRYEGTLSVTPDPDTGGGLVTLGVRMEPNRELLAPPVE